MKKRKVIAQIKVQGWTKRTPEEKHEFFQWLDDQWETIMFADISDDYVGKLYGEKR